MAEPKTARCYPLRIGQEADGGYVVTIPDIGYGATQGDTLEAALHQAEDVLEAALHQAEDLLEEAILAMMSNDEEVPSPSPARGKPVAGLSALTAAKLELYRAMRSAGLGKEEFAARLKWTPSQVTRLFDGRHALRLGQVETAMAALGRPLVVTSEAA